MEFRIEKKLEGAKNATGKFLGRAGVLRTPHGEIHTPAFVPVGTKATVKGLTPEMVKELGAEIALANTYHLYLQPGDTLVKEAGGLHKFMNWPGPLMTDSGGFQVFSLGAAYGKDFSKIIKGLEQTLEIPERSSADDGGPRLATVDSGGVSFRSHLDGSLHFITPEKSIEIQHNLGADIIFAFDEATSPYENKAYQEDALMRTHKWAERSLKEHQRLCAGQEASLSGSLSAPAGAALTLGPSACERPLNRTSCPALFGIVQGGLDSELRRQSAKFISSLDFDGFGIGGTYTKEHLHEVVGLVNEILPEEKPRHLLGIGEPEDLFAGIEKGVDLFDCVAPTRNARNGSLYTQTGKINILNEKFKRDFTPIEADCGCYTCRNYSRAYLAHLFRGKEMLGGTLATVHNLYFIINLVKNIRKSILEDNFYKYRDDFLKSYLV